MAEPVLASQLLETATEAAYAAGRELMARWGKVREADSKSGPADLVSEADLAADRAIQQVLSRQRPLDGVLSEESGARAGTSGLRWVIDPLDGTLNFLYRSPMWTVSIACEDEQGGLVGVVYAPASDELWSAQRGQPACYQGQPIEREQRRLPLGDAQDQTGRLVAAVNFGRATTPEFPRASQLAGRLQPRVAQLRQLGCASLDLAWAAIARVDLCYHEARLQPWDVAAGRLICQQAGMELHTMPPLAPSLGERSLTAPPDLVHPFLELVVPTYEPLV